MDPREKFIIPDSQLKIKRVGKDFRQELRRRKESTGGHLHQGSKDKYDLMEIKQVEGATVWREGFIWGG